MYFILKIGLPQWYFLVPILFNIYTNDQLSSPTTRCFLYANDLALTTQISTFEDAKIILVAALNKMGTYNEANDLWSNPPKAHSCGFHLRNRTHLKSPGIKDQILLQPQLAHGNSWGTILNFLTLSIHWNNSSQEINYLACVEVVKQTSQLG